MTEKLTTDNELIDNCLERLCQQGCRSVNQVIQQLEQGQKIDSIAHLDATHQQKLLHELKSLMAVYEITLSCGTDK